MFRRFLTLALAGLFALPVAALAQEAQQAQEMEEEPPPMMAISSWKCDLAHMGDINESWETFGRPAAQGVVDAGHWQSAGVFYHAWADEWNVNYYYLGKDIPTILEGWQQFQEAMPDEAPDLTDWCTAHKDGFYQFGRGTENEEGDE